MFYSDLGKKNPPTNPEEVAITSYLSSTEYFMDPSQRMS